MSIYALNHTQAEMQVELAEYVVYPKNEDDYSLSVFFNNTTQTENPNYEKALETLNNLEFPYENLDNKKTTSEIQATLCSSNNQETYDLETDAKETAAKLKEIIYDNTDDRIEKTLEFLENNLDAANIDLVLKEYENLTGEKDIKNILI